MSAFSRLDLEHDTVSVFGCRDVLVPEIGRCRHNQLFYRVKVKLVDGYIIIVLKKNQSSPLAQK